MLPKRKRHHAVTFVAGAIAIKVFIAKTPLQSRARLCSLNVLSKADRRACARKERNLHCDVYVAAENERTLPPFEYLDSFWIMRRDKGYMTFARPLRDSLD